MIQTATRLFPSLATFEVIDVLRLIRSENVGVVTFFNLIEQFGSPKAALDAIPTLSLRGGRKKPITVCAKAEAEREMEAVAKYGARFILYGQAEYPPLLHAIPDPPPLLIVKGYSHLWIEKTPLAIVGARNASASGYQFAGKIARECAEHGLLIVSGLARGIDTAAHKASLEKGTVAVIAGGIDSIYPPENKDLYENICETGIIVTEHPFGMAPHAGSFPSRNRIISGISQGTLIVEASFKSGSLITARFALEQGREVFAVPGSPLDPRCKGTNKLLKDGAAMVETTQDIFDHLHPYSPDLFKETKPPEFREIPARLPDESELLQARREILEKLSPTPVSVDELLNQCQLTPNVLWVVLLELELAGRLLRHPGNKVSLRLVDH